MTPNEVFLVAGMALVTLAVRYPLLAFLSKRTLSPNLIAALKFIPPAVLTAIIVPNLLAPDGTQVNLSLTNDYLVAGIVTAVVAWRSKNLLLTLGVGMATLWIWRILFLGMPKL
jgi:branched-subunit amino acid transport protein